MVNPAINRGVRKTKHCNKTVLTVYILSHNGLILFLNYYDDRITETIPVRDSYTFYSYKSLGVGLKMCLTLLDLSKVDLPIIISMTGGTSINFIEGKNILVDPNANIRYKYDQIYNLLVGFRTKCFLSEKFNLIVEYAVSVILGVKANIYHNYRNAIKIGVSLDF